jgi:TusA-related sulfurtransferase
MSTYSLSVIGEVCPVPLYKTQRKIGILEKGDVLVIETDFTRAVRNIMDWSHRSEHEVNISQVGNGIWQISIIKNY